MRIALTATPGAAQFAPILLQGDIADAFRTASELDCNGVELHLRQAEDVDLPELKTIMPAVFRPMVPLLQRNAIGTATK